MLGANDGIVSTASLIVGVAAAAATQNDVLIAGVAGLVAGAMSMPAGEYVSVSSQSDTEQADLARESKELSENVELSGSWNFYALLLAIVIHITGVIVTELREGGGIVSAMFTGRKVLGREPRGDLGEGT